MGATDTDRAPTRLEKLLTPSELAGMLNVPLSTVYRWNSTGDGPPYFKIGKHCRWKLADVEEWLAGHSDPRPAA